MTYCAPYGGSNTYRPMFVPEGVGLLRPPKPFPPLNNISRLVPVLRTEDHHPMHFFYYGEGCSDTHIRVSSRDAMVAYDRLEALRILARYRASKILIEKCSHQIELSSVKHLPWSILNQSPSTDLSAVRTAVSGSGCLNEVTHLLMRSHNIVTLVLNYEAPGSFQDATERGRKIEIIYLGTEFYDTAGAPCTLDSHKGCYYCNNSIYSQATCKGILRETLHPLRESPPPMPDAPPMPSSPPPHVFRTRWSGLSRNG